MLGVRRGRIARPRSTLSRRGGRDGLRRHIRGELAPSRLVLGCRLRRCWRGHLLVVWGTVQILSFVLELLRCSSRVPHASGSTLVAPCLWGARRLCSLLGRGSRSCLGLPSGGGGMAGYELRTRRCCCLPAVADHAVRERRKRRPCPCLEPRSDEKSFGNCWAVRFARRSFILCFLRRGVLSK